MFKKILSSLFVCHLLFSPAVFAQEVKGGILKEGVKPAKEPITQEFKTTEKTVKFSDNILKRTADDAIVPKKLVTTMKNSSPLIYGRDRAALG